MSKKSNTETKAALKAAADKTTETKIPDGTVTAFVKRDKTKSSLTPKEEIVSTKTEKAPKKSNKLEPSAHQKALKDMKALIETLPKEFMLKDRKEIVVHVDTAKSTVDVDTGEVMLVCVNAKDSVIARLAPETLKVLMKKVSKKGDKPKKAKEKRESNIPLMGRLILEGKTEAEIQTVFEERYATQDAAHKTPKWVAGRVGIYAKIACGTDPEIQKAYDKLIAARPKAKKVKKIAKVEKTAEEIAEQTASNADAEPKSKKQLKQERKAAEAKAAHDAAHPKKKA